MKKEHIASACAPCIVRSLEIVYRYQLHIAVKYSISTPIGV